MRHATGAVGLNLEPSSIMETKAKAKGIIEKIKDAKSAKKVTHLLSKAAKYTYASPKTMRRVKRLAERQLKRLANSNNKKGKV